MRVKVISRNPDDYVRETKQDINKVPRNFDPTLHPHTASREYVRALNATKLERVFAKPFLGSLDGHTEGVSAMINSPVSLSKVITAAYNGEIIMWDLPSRKELSKVTGHTGWVRGLCFHPSGEYFFSCGDDQVIRQWKSPTDNDEGFDTEPQRSIMAKNVLYGMDHHCSKDMFATCGQDTHIWDEHRNDPVKHFEWGVDSVQSIKFNPIEHNLLGACASDRSIILYDTRGANPMRKVVLKFKTNSISWNPMESYHFVCANEDYNAYTFDIRDLSRPVTLHRGHVSAVLDVDYSPTGREFVTAGFDRTIRLFDHEEKSSREVYHTKRMHIVRCVRWSKDNRYILSGSDETNIRVWKSNPAEKIGSVHPRMKSALNYNQALKERFEEYPQIRRIAKHRHIPYRVFKQQIELKAIMKSQARKQKNRALNAKRGTKVEIKKPIEDVVLREDE
ncbi:DDB1- and CUL4-associated factor 13-like [Watersipora subatra]|uniref:DDB1- and CUL4-associated factor 13-like n=1 Tax=Watersipora subatra TaxID=2589382 RepID=UPI00355C92B6